MRLRIAIAAVVVSMLVVFSSFGTMAQTPSLSSRIVDALKAKEPNWTYIGAIESGHIRLVPSEQPVIVGSWHGPNYPSQEVTVRVYSVKNRKEATKWLEPVRDKHVYEGWQVSPFQIGDEGYLSEYKDGHQFEIQFRKGSVVAELAGRDLNRAKEFAQCIVEQIDPNLD